MLRPIAEQQPLSLSNIYTLVVSDSVDVFFSSWRNGEAVGRALLQMTYTVKSNEALNNSFMWTC